MMNFKLSIFFLAAGLLAFGSCSVAEMEDPESDFVLNLSAEVSNMCDSDTKASLLDSDSDITDKTIKLYGWSGDSFYIQGANATYSAGKWSIVGNPRVTNKNNYSFLAYANLPSSGASITTPDKKDGNIQFTVSDITAAQTDMLLGRETLTTPSSGDLNLEFSHPYASVKFRVGNISDVATVTGISLTGVYASGKTTYNQASSVDGSGVTTYTWTNLGDANATLSATGLSKTEGQDIASFLVIPQALASKNAVLTITYGSGSTLTRLLNENSWEAGYTTVYTLDKILTVAVGISGVTITNSGDSKIYARATITGAWYDSDGNIVASWNTSNGTFSGLPGSGWSKSGSYYYYANGLSYGQSATALYSSYSKPTAPVSGAILKLEILAQAIPYNVNKTCEEAFAAL